MIFLDFNGNNVSVIPSEGFFEAESFDEHLPYPILSTYELENYLGCFVLVLFSVYFVNAQGLSSGSDAASRTRKET